ncbi:MAG: beta-galactosidase [Truepera sp.]|nr:beta-galactosidase [Truepera sp.]
MTRRNAGDVPLSKLLHGADYNYEQWLSYPDVLEADFRAMREAKINTVSIGIFAWSMLEPGEGDYRFEWLDVLMDRLAQEGLNAILATPSGARPAWLDARYPEVRQVDAQGRRQPHGGRHNHCRTSPIYRAKCIAINTCLAERYRGHPALFMWHVSNEYGATPCHCELCYDAFRSWLRTSYGDLDTLNHAWWTTFWSHCYSDWQQIEPLDPSIHGLMLDWQRFTSDQTIDFFLAESAPLRELTPEVPITTNFMQPEVGLNYHKFAQHVDIVSWDSYPCWHQGDDIATAVQTAFFHDLQRSYLKRPFMLMESTPSVTNWQGLSRPKQPGMHLLASLQALAHGSNTVQYFQWRQGRGGSEKFHGAVLDHSGSTATRVFREVAEFGQALTRLNGLQKANVAANIALIYDFENAWALANAELPHSREKRYQERCIAHYRALWRQQANCDVLSANSDFDSYQLLIAPMLYLMNEEVAARLEAFVLGGGTLVTTYLSGLVNESDLAHLGGFPPPFRRTLGLRVTETDAFASADAQGVVFSGAGPLGLEGHYTSGHYADLVQLEGAEALASYNKEFYTGSPAVTVHRYGAGEAYYLATRLEDRGLFEFYRALLARIGLAAGGRTLPEGISVRRRGEHLFVMNFSGTARHLAADVLAPFGLPCELTLPTYGVRVFISKVDECREMLEQTAAKG